MKKRKFQQGAISIFLVIVLVPCMVISSMFVDMSRVVLAKGYTTSAADLAMNSLMANYDPDLSEYYGMVASCQDIDQFYEESAYMFLEALYSQGIDADDAESLLGYINALALGTDVHDLYRLDVQTDAEKLITPVENGSLGESAVIIKDSVVEFMKYRGPIEITSKVIDRLSKTNAASVLSNSSADDALVEEKKDYADKEEDFMDAAYKTYKKVKEYEQARSDSGLNAEKMGQMVADLKDARETYREAVSLMVSNLNGNSHLDPFERPTRELNDFTYEAKDIATREEDGVYYIDGDDLLDDLEKRINEFKQARDAVSDKVVGVNKKLITGTVSESGDDNYHPIQWWKKIHELINSGSNSLISKVGTAADNMLKAYAKVLAMDGCTPGKNMPSGWEERRSKLLQSVTDLQARYLTADTFVDKDNLYLQLVNKLEDTSEQYEYSVQVTNVKMKNGKTTTENLKRISDKLSGHVDKLDTCIDLLNTIIYGGGIMLNNPYKLDTLGDKAKAYGEAFEDWSDTADSTDTTLGKNDREEISDMRNGKNGAAPKITKTDIGNFKTRLCNVKSKLESVKKAITDMKFDGKKLTEIANYTTAYDRIKNDIGENLTNKQVKNKATTVFKNNFTPYNSNKDAAVVSIDFSDKNYSPMLKENEPEFHKWLYKMFKDKDGESKKVKDKKKEKEKEAENAEKKAKDADRSGKASKINLYGNKDYVKADFPSELDGNLKFSLAEGFLSSLGNTVTSLTSGSFDSIRDSLYSTEYVMDMFSYVTYENEGKYRLGIENGTYKSAAEAEKAYKDNGYKAVTGAKDKSKTWLSDDTIDRYNKTLTNKLINSDNNILYGAEVEYVLYGKTNKENIKSAYADIYALRLPLNTISGFQNFWGTDNTTGRTINLTASALSTATSGIVPAAAIKVVAITLMAVTETAFDLDRLQKGFQVELYKSTDKQWGCAFSSSGKEADTDFSASIGEAEPCENGLFYSDYLYLFTLLGFQSDSASEMYRRTADLIQVNMRKYTGDSGYMMKNARSYFKLDATIRVDPLMLALPISRTVSNNPADRTDWCTFKIDEIRGYS